MNPLPLLDFRLRSPKSAVAKPPVLFLLHGYGSHEEDLFSFAPHLPDDFLIISLRAPLNLAFGGYAWYSIHFDADQDKWTDVEEAKAAQQILWHNIEHHLEQFGLKDQPINLLGFSQGAILSWALALSQPQKVDRVIALSGYVNEDIFTYSSQTLDHLQCFCSHGTQDQTIPVGWAKRSLERVQDKQVNIAFFEYAAGHGVAPENFQDLLEWLNRS